jgi:hypothetical protein
MSEAVLLPEVSSTGCTLPDTKSSIVRCQTRISEQLIADCAADNDNRRSSPLFALVHLPLTPDLVLVCPLGADSSGLSILRDCAMLWVMGTEDHS